MLEGSPYKSRNVPETCDRPGVAPIITNTGATAETPNEKCFSGFVGR
jgi:hypothetical protein